VKFKFNIRSQPLNIPMASILTCQRSQKSLPTPKRLKSQKMEESYPWDLWSLLLKEESVHPNIRSITRKFYIRPTFISQSMTEYVGIVNDQQKGIMFPCKR